MKNPLTPAGIERATFRFVAQHLDHCGTAYLTDGNEKSYDNPHEGHSEGRYLIMGHVATHLILTFRGQHSSTIKHTLHNHAQNVNRKFNNALFFKKMREYKRHVSQGNTVREIHVCSSDACENNSLVESDVM